MKILIVNFEYPPLGGGGGVATKDIAEELAKRHEVHVLTSAHEGLMRDEVTAGVVIHRVPVMQRKLLAAASLSSMISFIFSATLVLWKLTREKKFDVVNAQFVIPSGIPAALVARLRGIPLVVSFIGGDVYDPTKGTSPHRHGILRWGVRMISRQAKAGTAISQDTADRVRDLHGVKLPIEVTHLGVHLQEVAQVERETLGLPQDETLFASVGRLIPRKCYEVLIDAMRDVSGRLLIIGSGPLEDLLKRKAADSGVEDKVMFMGWLSEERKLQVLKASNAYVSTACHEGFGIVFLEAMAAGLPIVATNNGGHTDFLSDGVNGYLVVPKNVGEVAKAMNRLQDSDIRREMGKRNVEAVKDFTVEKTTERFEKVLQEAL